MTDRRIRWTMDRMREVDRMRRGGLSLKYIAEMNGVSKERIRQVEAKYKRKIKLETELELEKLVHVLNRLHA
jgi:DNA-directed RNA polymerase sigma subunit (sigma70/sigma32)